MLDGSVTFVCLSNRASMRKTESFSLRLSAEVKKRLFEEAKKENRSVANYLETILKEVWKTKGGNQTTSKKGL
jgi:hypothetical protein